MVDDFLTLIVYINNNVRNCHFSSRRTSGPNDQFQRNESRPAPMAFVNGHRFRNFFGLVEYVDLEQCFGQLCKCNQTSAQSLGFLSVNIPY